jgi:DNA invertase Pin-like site-specific DNA recombinase
MTKAQEIRPLKVARVYQRVSDDNQDLTRQKAIETDAIAAGYYIAGVYSEKASGARADRPELLRMIAELRPGDVVIAERMDRISRLPLEEAEKLIKTIRAKGARLSVPGIVDLSELAATADRTTKLVLEAVQELLLKIALQAARDDYETRRERQRQGIELAKQDRRYKGRPADVKANKNIVAHRKAGKTIAETAELTDCSVTHVKRIWRAHQDQARESA